MIEEEFHSLVSPILREGGSVACEGEEFREPALDVLRYDYRPVRLNLLPWIGRAASVVITVRQPIDVEFTVEGYVRLRRRMAGAVHGRFPPFSKGSGLAIGLTAIILTPEPIGAQDDGILDAALKTTIRGRVLPLGLIRVNLGQEALAFALARGPGGLFPDPEKLVDGLIPHLRRYVPLLEA